MAQYLPPIREIEHALYGIAGMAELASLAEFEEATPDLVHAILEEAGRFAANVLSPINRTGDLEGARLEDGEVRTPAGWKDAYRTWIESGWGGIAFPAEFGGHGLPRLLATAAHEMWQGANMAFTLNPMLTNAVADAILLHGSETQKKRLVSPLVSGEWTGTMCLTEPQAGSDLGAIRCKAVPEGDSYRISGQKIFITYGEHDLAENILHMVLARIPGAPDGVKGISLFIVPKIKVSPDGTLLERNSVRCVSLEHKLGIHASPTSVLAFGDGEGAEGYLVGEANRGLEYMFTMMNESRLAVGVQGIGIAEQAFQAARHYARERIQGKAYDAREGKSVPIIRHPDVKRMLITMKSEIEAMRGLAYCTAAWLDKAEKHPDPAARKRSLALAELLTPVVKGWCTEQGVLIASAAVQVHGGTGYIEETGVAQYLRDARIATIYEGTTGIQANDLMDRKVRRNGGESMRALVDIMRGTLAELDDGSDLALQLEAAIDALERATSWVLAQKSESGLPAAAAVPYLHLLGTVAGGWVMARSALAAIQKLKTDTEHADFCRARLATAKFYADNVLPRAAGLTENVVRGSEAVFALDEALI
ncbi:MAG: acyl-CoA dehydrogenase [Pseudomonadota bacterium]